MRAIAVIGFILFMVFLTAWGISSVNHVRLAQKERAKEQQGIEQSFQYDSFPLQTTK